MKKYIVELFGLGGYQHQTSSYQFPPRGRGTRRCSLSLIVCNALCLFVLAQPGTALAWVEGGENNFFGTGAGAANTPGVDPDGRYNSFFGGYAGNANTTGHNNSFFGRGAGYANTTGHNNSFFGRATGGTNTTGYQNSFFGQSAGILNTTGKYNSFFGWGAGDSNTTGDGNSFFGIHAGKSNTVEPANTLIGSSADLDPGADPATAPVHNATAIGYRSYVAKSNSLVLGSIAGLNQASPSEPTVNVNVGIGTPIPARQLHLKGDNAVFRMDRSADTAAFMIVRIDGTGNPMKTFVVGTNASGVDTGEFVINDLGAAVSGPGTRRMTITTNGAIEFTGIVTAPQFIPTSSLAYKTNVRTYENSLEKVKRLRGVSFDWKGTGKPSVGLIAEEVAAVIPEVVLHEGGAAKGGNYDSLVGVLVEAFKEQQTEMDSLRGVVKQQQEAISQLMAEIAKLKTRDMIAQR
jgi:hypothetical protein